jgi:multicomponent Na+:H+ antiporter subunit F
MTDIYLGVALFVLLNVLAGLLRVVRGPTTDDRMIAAMLFGTSGVAILLILAQALHRSELRNVALVLSALAAVNTIAFVRHGWREAARRDTR